MHKVSRDRGDVTFVRHSFSCGNATKRNWFVRDPALTDGGVHQIAGQCAQLPYVTNYTAASERYRNEGWDVDTLRENPWFDPAKPWIIFSSELLRSMETAIGLRECLREQGQKVVNRVLVAPFLAERGLGLDNKPESVRTQRKRLGPQNAALVNFSLIEGDNKWLARQKPDLRKFVQWLQMMKFGTFRWNDFNVLVVTHSVLMKDTFGVMLNNLGAIRARVGPNPGQLDHDPKIVEMGVPPSKFRGVERCKRRAEKSAGTSEDDAFSSSRFDIVQPPTPRSSNTSDTSDTSSTSSSSSTWW